MKYTLATSTTCGPCQALKKRLEAANITVEVKNYSDSSNIPWFRERSVRNVPCLVIEDIFLRLLNQ
jgi:glutaredoxin